MEYAGFWVRVLAKLIDLLIFLPLYIISIIFNPNNKQLSFVISVSITILILLYNIILIYSIGKTPGKIVMKLKVLKTDGEKVGIVNSIAREVFAIISILIWIIQKFGMSAEFINTLNTSFAFVSSFEVLVCLFNYRHKTTHDFIGNTVVIKELNF
jgi:uncharacterized RDD family membrane protein YckC